MSTTIESNARSWNPRSAFSGSRNTDSAISGEHSPKMNWRPSERRKPIGPSWLNRVVRRPTISFPTVKPFAPCSQIITIAMASGKAAPTPIRIWASSVAFPDVTIRITATVSGTIAIELMTPSMIAASTRFKNEPGTHPSNGAGSVSWLCAGGALRFEDPCGMDVPACAGGRSALPGGWLIII